METKHTGEAKILKIAKAPNLVEAFRAAYLAANRKARCPIVGIAQSLYYDLIEQLIVGEEDSIRFLPDGRVIWKGGVVLIPFLVTDKAAMALPQYSSLMFINDRGEIVYGI